VSAHWHLSVSPIISSVFSRSWLRNLCCCNLVHCKTEALDCLSVLLLNAAGSGGSEIIVLTARCWVLSIASWSLMLCTECEDIATWFSICDLVLYCVTLTALRWKSFISKITNFVTRFFLWSVVFVKHVTYLPLLQTTLCHRP